MHSMPMPLEYKFPTQFMPIYLEALEKQTYIKAELINYAVLVVPY